MRSRSFHTVACLALAAAVVTTPTFATGDNTGHYTTRATFDDVVFELDNAIVSRGLAIHSAGNQFAKMLERTGADVGSTKPVYKHATFTEVCSAKYARMMVEADPALISNCPFIFFAYERIDRPGEVTVGYRRLSPGSTPAAKAAVTETEALLDAIVREAAK
jgi:uncharacterized protein (DUF302 family)